MHTILTVHTVAPRYQRLLSFHIPLDAVTRPSRRAASMNAPSCSIVRS